MTENKGASLAIVGNALGSLIAVAVVSLVGATYSVIGRQPAVVGAAFGALFFASARWGLPLVWDRQKKQSKWWPPLPEGREFSIREPKWNGDTSRKHMYLFERHEEVHTIKERIARNDKGVLYVTGPSGAGKSCLLQMVLAGFRKENKNFTGELVDLRYDSPSSDHSLRHSDDLIGRLNHAKDWLADKALPNVGQGTNPLAVLVLDQFEEALDSLANQSSASAELRTVVKDLFAMVKNPTTMRIVIVSPSDRYYEMQEHGLASPQEIRIGGIEAVNSRGFVARQLAKVGFSQPEAEKIVELLATEGRQATEGHGTISPLTAQLVGYEIERRNCFRSDHDWPRPFLAAVFRDEPKWTGNHHTKLTFNDYISHSGFGGTRAIIDGFFSGLIRASPYPGITTEVLFTMSSQSRGGSITAKTLSDLSLQDERQVQTTLTFLEESGVCRKTEAGWSIRHDLLRDYAKEWTGQVMRPTLRDNLAHGAHALETGAASLHALRGSTARYELLKLSLALLAIAMFVFVVWRLGEPALTLGPGWDGFRAFFGFGLIIRGPFEPYAVDRQWGIDYHYLPIALLQFAWGMYVFVLVRRVFWPIGHTWHWLRPYSVMLVTLVVLGLIGTAFVPSLWLMWHGLIGMALGLPFAIIGWGIKRITHKLGNEFWQIGYRSLMLNFPCMLAGAQLIPRMKWDLVGAQNPFGGLLGFQHQQSITQGLAVVGLLIFFSLYGRHASPMRCRELIGLFHRTDSRRRQVSP